MWCVKLTENVSNCQMSIGELIDRCVTLTWYDGYQTDRYVVAIRMVPITVITGELVTYCGPIT